MNKKNLTLKETFQVALENYKKKNFFVAQDLCNKILNIEENHFESLVLLSNIFALNMNFNKAKDLLIKANEIKPNNLSVLNNLGTAFKELRNFKESIKYYEKVIKINPNHTSALYNLGIAFYNSKDFKKAKLLFLKTTEIQPKFAVAFNNLANVNVELKEYSNAVRNYQKAIEINPKLVSAHNNLGLVFRILNDYENAINCYESALEIKKDSAGTYHNLALALKEQGRFEEAIKAHEMSIKYEPDNLINYFYLSELKKSVLDDDLKNKVLKLLENKKINKSYIAYGNYLLSRYEKNVKNYEKEFNFLIKGHHDFFNSRKAKFDLGIKYCFEDVPKISASVKVETSKAKNSSEIKPIFIIGVPRCGSTLVEKIIGSTQQLIPMGEETAIVENFINQKILEKQSLNLGNLSDVSKELTDVYKKKGLVHKKHNYVFTDKSLNNFYYLEILKDIYPEALFINCRRNILSSIMSIFQNNITELAWAHDLDNIFKYFDKYFEIIENYNQANPNLMYELEFDKLINNPEEESKKLMNFCKLPWDKNCLEFYKRKDLISKTASNIQIRQAIYKDSVNKYLPYKKFLDKYGEKYLWFN
jgi:tetratricopeptide (TPR) repeat protein